MLNVSRANIPHENARRGVGISGVSQKHKSPRHDTVVLVNASRPRLLGLEVPAETLQGVHDSELRERIGPKLSRWISIGVSAVSKDYTPEAALQQADKALYQAKRSGRNRVCLWQTNEAVVD